MLHRVFIFAALLVLTTGINVFWTALAYPGICPRHEMLAYQGRKDWIDGLSASMLLVGGAACFWRRK